MKKDAIGVEARESERERVLGEDAVCVLCPEARVHALVAIEAHHVVGRHHEPGLTVPICATHHRLVHAGLRDAGMDLRPQPSLLERLMMILTAVGTFLIELGKACLSWATELREEIARQAEAAHA